MAPTNTNGTVTTGIWDLVTGQNTYTGQNAQDPRSARKLQSWIPSDDGELHRELPEPLYLTEALSGPVVSMYEFDQNDGNGNTQRFYFAAARTDFQAGTKTCNLYQNISGHWAQVSLVNWARMSEQFDNNGPGLAAQPSRQIPISIRTESWTPIR
jgi:hypothetical protein